jgi:hypothetical protein
MQPLARISSGRIPEKPPPIATWTCLRARKRIKKKSKSLRAFATAERKLSGMGEG